MLRCQQKYCKNCIKPRFDLSGKFVFGHCKSSKYLILISDKEETQDNGIQPLLHTLLIHAKYLPYVLR